MHVDSVIAKNAVITTPKADATEAGYQVLKEGGTAIDALITAGAVMSVTSPHMVGLGGDALWMLNHKKHISTISGIGQAGQRLPHSGKIQLRGNDSIATTAAAVASWHTAYEISQSRWHSKLPWSRLLEPAIELARDGCKVSDSQVFWQEKRKQLIKESPDLQRICENADANPFNVGDHLYQPSLANSLESLSRHGGQSFYTGELGDALAQGFSERDLCLTADDLAATRAPELEPLQSSYRNGHLYNVMPPSQGITTLHALSILNQFNLNQLRDNPSDYYHLMVEAIKTSLKQRNLSLCDPSFQHLNTNDWLNNAAKDAANIDLQKAAGWADVSQPADTAWMSAIDPDGHSVSLIQSLYYDWGSACMIGDTGILWHNRAAGFSTVADHANAWSPGKRPAHTLNPSLYIRDNGEHTLFGSQGGDGQPQTQTVLATQLFDFNNSICDSLYAPRFLLGRSFFDSDDNLKIEAHLDPLVVQQLRDRGHDIEIIPELSPLAGLAGIARINSNGTREAMHDPRGDGLTLGF